MDLQRMSLADIGDLEEAIRVERARRLDIETFQTALGNAIRGYLTLDGVHEGDPWRPPHSALDAYPVGWLVEHAGSSWRSRVVGCLTEPGIDGWDPVGDEPTK